MLKVRIFPCFATPVNNRRKLFKESMIKNWSKSGHKLLLQMLLNGLTWIGLHSHSIGIYSDFWNLHIVNIAHASFL